MMKKITLVSALLALSFSMSAQTINVQSAAQDLKKGYLNKAKDEIDLACEHENTKNDAKTWYYAGLIYSQIGNEATNPKSKFKNLAPDWCEKALNAAMRCKELDTDNEFAEGNNGVFRFVGNEFYTRAVNAYNDEKDYPKTVAMCEEAIKVFSNSGDKKFTMDAYYLAGIASQVQKDNDAVLKYFKPLVRTKTDKEGVYKAMFEIYKAKKDTVEAAKIAKSYVKNCPNDYKASLLMAQAYLLSGNIENGRQMIDDAVNKAKDKPEIYASLLGAAASILEETKDYEGAEAKYNESLSLNPNQFEANYGFGKMIFNRGVDKLDAANAVPPDDESGLYDKLVQESNEFFSQSIQYFRSAVSYIDGLDESKQAMQRANLFNCLNALKQIYARLERYDDLKPINARIDQLTSQQ